jgi:threonyl-tRNA synthetase
MSEMFKISLPDGSSREMPQAPLADVAAAIPPGCKAALAARVDVAGRLSRPFTGDATLTLVTARDERTRWNCPPITRCAAEAVQALFPERRSPSAIDRRRFYYDFAPKDRAFTEEDLPAIRRNARIIAADKALRREVWLREFDRAVEGRGREFQAEWAGELPDGEADGLLVGYDWLDMCRGPHRRRPASSRPMPSADSRVGAYWRGDQNNAMLSRVWHGWLSKGS